MTELNNLIAIQRDMLADLEELKDSFLAKSTSEKTRGYLDILSSELDVQFQTFKYQHDEISRIIRDTSLPVEDVPYMSDKCFSTFRELYFSFKGIIAESAPLNITSRSPFNSTFAQADMTATMEPRLPKISLPTFVGDYMDWIPFRDIYVSLVHTNMSLSKVQKFYYLKGSLSGEAACLIKTISATEANYDSAWTILEARYHNERMIVGSLITKLFNIPKTDGSFQSIKRLLDTTQECLSSLGNLNINTSNWDPILIHLTSQKLDLPIRKEWEQSLNPSTKVPSRLEMFSFLERTFRTLESLGDSLPSTSNSAQKSSRDTFKNKKVSVHTGNIPQTKSISCLFCERNHFLSKCYKFLALSLKLKNEFLMERKICRNCLSSGHEQDNCTSLYRCGTCKKPHHTVLHAEETVSVQNSSIGSPSSDLSTSDLTSQTAFRSSNNFHNVLLYTIRLFVRTDRGMYPLRALLDPGSQGSLISESSVQLLGLFKRKSHCKVVGVGTGNENLSKYVVQLDLWSRKHQPILSCSALVLSSISSYTPNQSSRNLSLPTIKNDSLADPFFYNSDSIDIILGSDICSKIKIPTESFIHEELFFQNTAFGWVFSGSSESVPTNKIHFHNINLENILKSFWQQEEVVVKKELTDEELACEKYFKDTTKRTASGRYMVNLPFKSTLVDGSSPKLHNNINGALKRFKQLEISFFRRPSFSEIYKDFMLEYEALGHMSKIGTFPDDVHGNSYFLPHHGVFKEDSTTTKLRVVFDGS